MTSRGPPPAAAEAPKLVAADRLQVLRTELITLIDALYTFQQQISYGGQESMMSWPDLVAKYATLLSHTHGISTQLGKPPHAAAQSQRELERNLSRVSVFPGKPVEQSLEYRVGMLLRTKQYPEVEEAQAALLNGLPAELVSKDGVDADQAFNALKEAQEGHDKLIRFALRRLRAISGLESAAEDESDDDEDAGVMQEDGEPLEYDWKMRLELSTAADTASLSTTSPSLQQVASTLRDGR